MARSTWLRGVVVALVAVFAILPARALGAKPEIVHEHFLDMEEDADVCGIAVDLVAEGVFTDKVFTDKDGNFVRFQSTSTGKVTFTAANGKSVVNLFANQYAEGEPIVDEEAGTITFVYSYVGLPEILKTPNGPVLVRDAGLITFADTFDLETEEFISGEVLVNNGPHPDADSDFELFCEVITEALS